MQAGGLLGRAPGGLDVSAHYPTAAGGLIANRASSSSRLHRQKSRPRHRRRAVRLARAGIRARDGISTRPPDREFSVDLSMRPHHLLKKTARAWNVSNRLGDGSGQGGKPKKRHGGARTERRGRCDVEMPEGGMRGRRWKGAERHGGGVAEMLRRRHPECIGQRMRTCEQRGKGAKRRGDHEAKAG
jgi:hypothetical protein